MCWLAWGKQNPGISAQSAAYKNQGDSLLCVNDIRNILKNQENDAEQIRNFSATGSGKVA
jgi:hypothetical protein